jgi:hypothetical protein
VSEIPVGFTLWRALQRCPRERARDFFTYCCEQAVDNPVNNQGKSCGWAVDFLWISCQQTCLKAVEKMPGRPVEKLFTSLNKLCIKSASA